MFYNLLGDFMSKKETVDKIKAAIEEIRPYLNMDGGDIEFIKYENKVVFVKLSGACQACMYTDDTLNNGVLETLKKDIPEIENVINVKL